MFAALGATIWSDNLLRLTPLPPIHAGGSGVQTLLSSQCLRLPDNKFMDIIRTPTVAAFPFFPHTCTSMTLKHYREKLKLTPLQMAKRWKISRITYTGWEDGVHAPRGKLIDSILRIEAGRLSRAELLDTPHFRQAPATPSGATATANGARYRAQRTSGRVSPAPASSASAQKQPAKLDINEIIELGARSIFEFRAHPRRGLWQDLEPAKKEQYYQNMRQILAQLGQQGFEPRPADHSDNQPDSDS